MTKCHPKQAIKTKARTNIPPAIKQLRNAIYNKPSNCLSGSSKNRIFSQTDVLVITADGDRGIALKFKKKQKTNMAAGGTKVPRR